MNKQQNPKKKADISGILSRFLTPQFHYRLDIIVDFLKPLRYLSKLTQTRDALATEVFNQIRMTRNNFNMKDDRVSDERAAEMIESMTWKYIRNVVDENGEKKKLRTKVKLIQLRSARPQGKEDLMKDREEFK